LNQFESPEGIFDGLNTDEDGKAIPSKPKNDDKESGTKSPKVDKEEESMIKPLNLSDEELE